MAYGRETAATDGRFGEGDGTDPSHRQGTRNVDADTKFRHSTGGSAGDHVFKYTHDDLVIGDERSDDEWVRDWSSHENVEVLRPSLPAPLPSGAKVDPAESRE